MFFRFMLGQFHYYVYICCARLFGTLNTLNYLFFDSLFLCDNDAYKKVTTNLKIHFNLPIKKCQKRKIGEYNAAQNIREKFVYIFKILNIFAIMCDHSMSISNHIFFFFSSFPTLSNQKCTV